MSMKIRRRYCTVCTVHVQVLVDHFQAMSIQSYTSHVLCTCMYIYFGPWEARCDPAIFNGAVLPDHPWYLLGTPGILCLYSQ